MEKNFDINEQGHSIRCKLFYGKEPHSAENVVLILHGFGSSKEVKSNSKFGERLAAKYKNYAAIAFDLPAHGADARKKLTVTECLEYIRLVADYAKEKLHARNLYAYATSFGGYLALKYIAEKGNPFTKIALRAPAVQMRQTLLDNMTEDERNKVAKGKEVMLGFERKMKIGKDFLDELERGDIQQYEYFNFADNILIIHGTADEMVNIATSQEFADNNVIELIAVEGADHPFSNPKHMDWTIGKVVEFLAP
ncbi:alpha/beta hydrolase [Actinobacillus succinogenes]|uniref:Serine aminopeptidase S33 domain-containing protein n=1 Tax=Actinobacillus succinogenes (strain ATCC 55618 / DSM 22257 / CCUG 43843 / 130Z) TaxID=339671 RepID=A6VNX2_ACTSZ|nr:alpha/beta fold hydrolase [Actinobacillus succinogenes]ABR74669.1 conserved hypothetical protein [Actinobacillus succinogenes 130Z]PHI40909.1 alpha/beta hydrolase [Actinobacillus succinogenes]